MKAKPILFQGDMIRAILDGRKTQTRRIVKDEPVLSMAEIADKHCLFRCPYGQPGDLLWVREPWQAWSDFDRYAPRDIPRFSGINYLADGNKWDARKRHARFMVRWMSRIALEITDVRIERLQDISEKDARSEGVSICSGQAHDPHAAFSNLWDSIHGSGSWRENPLVWVIHFAALDEQ